MANLKTMDPATSAAAADERLCFWFDGCPRAAVAFSGGVDSALVAWYAVERLGPQRANAWIADTPSLKRSDLQEAQSFCQRFAIPLQVIATTEIDDPAYASNPADRCYHCKTTLYSTLLEALPQQVAADTWVCSGANLDDRGDYRPGLRAAGEHAIRHPLLECGIGKELIRALARRHGLPNADKPASPCLSSRIPYGQAVTRDKLQQIEGGEAWLAEHGFPIARLRHHGARAVIEVPVDRVSDLQAQLPFLREHVRMLGFSEVVIDDEGFVSGKLNRDILT